jgi:hypothetical protein
MLTDNCWTNWYIKLYEYFPCKNKPELHRREGEVISEIGTINKNISSGNKIIHQLQLIIPVDLNASNNSCSTIGALTIAVLTFHIILLYFRLIY